LRTVYLGTSDYAVSVLERLAGSEHRPTLVVTRPDRPAGRGRRLKAPPAAVVARELGIEVFQPDNVNSDEARERIAAERPEAAAICAFGGLIKEPLLSDQQWLNVHPSLLPRWRGAAPIERAIMAGDELTGVSIMRPTAEMDAGPVCLRRAEPVRHDDDFASLSVRLAVIGGELLVEALDTRPEFEEQPDEGVTIAPKIEAEDRRLDPARPAAELQQRVRALTPHVGAWIELPDGERLGVRRAAVVAPEGEGVPSPAAGRFSVREGRLLVGAGDGKAIELLSVQPPGGRPMAASDYLRGRGSALGAGAV
jgi:methionyl-tRNA formyltransferase